MCSVHKSSRIPFANNGLISDCVLTLSVYGLFSFFIFSIVAVGLIYKYATKILVTFMWHKDQFWKVVRHSNSLSFVFFFFSYKLCCMSNEKQNKTRLNQAVRHVFIFQDRLTEFILRI